MRLAKRVQDATQSNAESDVTHEIVKDELTEEHSCDSQLLFWILREELVFIKQVVHHARENIAFALHLAHSESAQHLHQLPDGLLHRIHALEVAVGLFFHIRREALRSTGLNGQILRSRARISTFVGRVLNLRNELAKLRLQIGRHRLLRDL